MSLQKHSHRTGAKTEPCGRPSLNRRSLLLVEPHLTRARLSVRNPRIYLIMHLGTPGSSSLLYSPLFHTVSYAVLKSRRASTDLRGGELSRASKISWVTRASCSSALLPLRNPAWQGANLSADLRMWYRRDDNIFSISFAMQLRVRLVDSCWVYRLVCLSL